MNDTISFDGLWDLLDKIEPPRDRTIILTEGQLNAILFAEDWVSDCMLGEEQ